MLTPVGLVDTGRISVDTGHSFQRTKDAAPGIAARFYMHYNFFVNDPDAFNVTDSYLMEDQDARPPVSLSAAQASIALSAVSGGMYEIGDDMLTLSSEKDRLALVENADLLNMAKIGRASTPLDLMTYEPEDQQPSIFVLRESPHQAILTVFNWTKNPRSHTLKLADLGLPADHKFSASDVLNPSAPVTFVAGTARIENQLPESVKVIKLTDESAAPRSPSIKAEVPSEVNAGETVHLGAQTDADSVPALGYHWDFGDGGCANGAKVSHAYTKAGSFTIRLTVDGVDGIPAVQSEPIKVVGNLSVLPKLTDNRRFQEPPGH